MTTLACRLIRQDSDMHVLTGLTRESIEIYHWETSLVNASVIYKHMQLKMY